MMKFLSKSTDRSERRFQWAAAAAAISLFLVILSGGVVSATGTAGTCPDWPTCLGQWTPPEQIGALLNYTHRAVVLLALPFVAAAAFLGRKSRRSSPAVLAASTAALILLLAQIGLGAVISLRPSFAESALLGPLHTILSVLALGASAAAAVPAFYAAPRRIILRSPFAHLSLATLGLSFALMLSGAMIQSAAGDTVCNGWPLCGRGIGSLSSLQPGVWLHIGHRLLVAITAILVMALLRRAWRTQRTQAPILAATTAMAVLFFAQALLGARLVQGFPPYLLVVHQATAAAAWVALVVQVMAVGIAGRSAEDENLEAAAIVGRTRLARDLLMLTKPIVVLLLLVTTYAGMVIGARSWPSFSITFWTLLGGFMAAGGSGAINQYIDRNDDGRMQRTQKRPIPAGRLTPAEGLAFGIGIALASFYLLTAFVNFLAALLSLAGIIYYVLLYSVFLKKTTVQNIVIGGGAGAIPPLVGWAAATGSLNFPSLFLFAIVFMWTPPHFWALALVRRADYARAGVPMLPVVRGENETRRQILIYTIELVALSLLLPIFGLGGSVYFVLAAALGGWLLLAAWKVWKHGGNKLAFKMYRYSSMYLAFLFVGLMIDRLL